MIDIESVLVDEESNKEVNVSELLKVLNNK